MRIFRRFAPAIAPALVVMPSGALRKGTFSKSENSVKRATITFEVR